MFTVWVNEAHSDAQKNDYLDEWALNAAAKMYTVVEMRTAGKFPSVQSREFSFRFVLFSFLRLRRVLMTLLNPHTQSSLSNVTLSIYSIRRNLRPIYFING